MLYLYHPTELLIDVLKIAFQAIKILYIYAIGWCTPDREIDLTFRAKALCQRESVFARINGVRPRFPGIYREYTDLLYFNLYFNTMQHNVARGTFIAL